MFLPNKKDSLHKAWLYRVLTEIADDDFLVSVLRFKGGTCAAMRGLLDRFSVDLDFDFTGHKKDLSKTGKKLENIFHNLGLEIKDKSKNTTQYFLKYDDKDGGRNTLKTDTFFPPLLGNKYVAVRIVDIDRIVFCQTIETMFANKLIALVARFEKGNTIAVRDLYDIHFFFLNGFEYDGYIISTHSKKDVKSFFVKLYKFVDEKITQKMIDQDLNFLLSPESFKKIRKTLKAESLVFITDEIKRLDDSSN